MCNRLCVSWRPESWRADLFIIQVHYDTINDMKTAEHLALLKHMKQKGIEALEILGVPTESAEFKYVTTIWCDGIQMCGSRASSCPMQIYTSFHDNKRYFYAFGG